MSSRLWSRVKILDLKMPYVHTYGSFKQEDGSALDNLVAPAASMKHYLSADIMFLYYILRDSLTDAAIELLC